MQRGGDSITKGRWAQRETLVIRPGHRNGYFFLGCTLLWASRAFSLSTARAGPNSQ
jgi:hypothetical protein